MWYHGPVSLAVSSSRYPGGKIENLSKSEVGSAHGRNITRFYSGFNNKFRIRECGSAESDNRHAYSIVKLDVNCIRIIQIVCCLLYALCVPDHLLDVSKRRKMGKFG